MPPSVVRAWRCLSCWRRLQLPFLLPSSFRLLISFISSSSLGRVLDLLEDNGESINGFNMYSSSLKFYPYEERAVWFSFFLVTLIVCTTRVPRLLPFPVNCRSDWPTEGTRVIWFTLLSTHFHYRCGTLSR